MGDLRCQGTNCGTTTGDHSEECLREAEKSQGWEMTIKSTLTDAEIKSAAERGYIFGQYIEMIPSCRRVADAAAAKERSRCADYLLSLVTLYGDDLNILDVLDTWEHWRI